MVVLLYIMLWDSFLLFYSIQNIRKFFLFNDLVGSNLENEIKICYGQIQLFLYFFLEYIGGKNIIYVYISKLGKSMLKNRENICFFIYKIGFLGIFFEL